MDYSYKHKLNSDTSNEYLHESSKRLKSDLTDENSDPSTSATKSISLSYRRQSIIRSASKSSPIPSVLLGEMGLSVLDSDESNQSSLIGNAIASMVQQPSSALSMIPSESSTDAPHIESDSAESFDAHFDTNISSIDTTNSLSNMQMKELTNEPFHGYQDFTPANLVACNRTNFTGAIADLTASNVTETSSASKNDDLSFTQQPEGRAIRSTSMRQYHNQNTDGDSMLKQKVRSPLASITNSTELDAVTRTLYSDNDFFMFQKRDPRNYTGPDNFATLSDEVLLSIFKWLPKKALARCSLVNQRFNRVVQDESLWTRLDLAGKTIQPYALGRILQRGVIIFRLAQTKIPDELFDANEIRKDFLSKLQFLDLSMAVISPNALTQLFSKCRYLRKVSLEHVPINDAVCKALAQNRKLEVLNLAMSSGITAYGIRKLFGTLKHLNTLNISWTSLELDAIEEFSNYVSENMQRLNIAGCRKLLTDEILRKLVGRCPLLCELDLSDCTSLTSQTIDIVAKLDHLEYLSLSRCYNINVSAYLEINKLKTLAYLDIFGVLSQQALTILINSFPGLGINKFKHSAVARPTVGSRRTSIWGLRTRD